MPNFNNPIPPWKPGQALGARQLNRTVDQLRQMQPTNVAGTPIGIPRTANSLPYNRQFVVILTATEAGRGKYTGIVSVLPAVGIDADSDLTNDQVGGGQGYIENCLIINPAETTGDEGLHALTADDSTIYSGVFIGPSYEANPRPTFALLSGGGSTQVRLLKITDTATARGEYVGRMSVGTLTPADGTTDITVGNVWVDPGADNCIVLNPAEVTGDAGSHALPVGDDKIYSAIISGISDEATPRPEAILIGDDGDSGVFPVLVKAATGDDAGADGTCDDYATWAYDVFAVNDTAMATALNGDTPLQPLASAARVFKGPVTAAADGSYGVAFYGSTGDLQLWNCQEHRVLG